MSNTKGIIRQLRIDMITDTPNVIIEWFDSLCSTIYIENKDNYESFYYIKNTGICKYFKKKTWIFYYNHEEEYFHCNYEKYWMYMMCNLHINNKHIGPITKFLVDNKFNENIPIPRCRLLTRFE